MSPITVAIIGATGLLGGPVTRAFLSSTFYPTKISRVLIVTRDPSSAKAKALTDLGAEAITATEDSVSGDHFRGVDAVVNCLPTDASVASKNAYAKAAAEAGVKVYIPSEYGLDHRVIDIQTSYFKDKVAHIDYAREVGGEKMKTISVYAGGFLDVMLTTPYFGFNHAEGVFTCFGDPNTKAALTSMNDVGLSLAQISVMASADPASIPEYVRIMGDCKSPQEIADIMSKERGESIKVNGNDYEKMRRELDEKAKGEGHRLEYVRLFFASGKVDWTNDNQDELINPGQSLWKWRTVEDLAKKSKGRPVFGA